ncbi:MAG TPA: transcription antitermination factor NusB [Elusimicrobiota bacterium]|nr:transcription antitermination factor NusB [Elusimicrobiota bacterium]
MGARRQAREAALQILYLVDVGKFDLEKAAAACWTESTLAPRARTFADDLARGALENMPLLDGLITKYAENWELSRMAAVDRNILRLTAYELLFHVDTPVSVAIDEAVEIAKTYSTQDSGKFVNGILDKIKLERGKTAPPTPAAKE